MLLLLLLLRRRLLLLLLLLLLVLRYLLLLALRRCNLVVDVLLHRDPRLDLALRRERPPLYRLVPPLYEHAWLVGAAV